jgi:thiamine-phosphate pyrophosphorylase
MKPGAPLGRLHAITDASRQDRFSHGELAELASRGGADTVQFREKRACGPRALIAEARRIHTILSPYAVELIVNDHPAVAFAAGAAGVHLGDSDVGAREARDLLGPHRRIGKTANDLAAALVAADEPVDYLGVGPVFGTRSKVDPAPALGLRGLREIVAAVGQPVIAIGGIDAERVGDVLATGVYGVAVLSAFTDARDPASAIARIREIIGAHDAGRVEHAG